MRTFCASSRSLQIATRPVTYSPSPAVSGFWALRADPIYVCATVTHSKIPKSRRATRAIFPKPLRIRYKVTSHRTDRAPSRPTTGVEQTHTLFHVVPEALHHRLSFPHSSNSSQIYRYRLCIQSACPQSMTPPRNAILHHWPPCHFPLSPQPRVNGRLPP